MGRHCIDCNSWCDSNDFSNSQWSRGPGNSRCRSCVGWPCAQCRRLTSMDGYSRNQRLKGEGKSRCRSCVDLDCNNSYCCDVCERWFSSLNALNMHKQVHRPRDISCPLCGECRYKSVANAVQHIESGYCSHCRGKENARKAIFKFAQGQGVRMLEWDQKFDGIVIVPEVPYYCQECGKGFRHMSQLLQHRDQKHASGRFLTNV